MSVSALGGAAAMQSRLIADLEQNGLSAASADKVGSEIQDIVEELRQSGSGRPDKSSIREAIEDQLNADVSAGTLTQDEADQVLATLDSFDAKQAQGRQGGPRTVPDPAELFAKLDQDGDGTLTRDEFVAGRPDDVSEEHASAFFNQLSGGEDSLTAEQFTQAFAQAGPPAGGPPPGGGAPGAGGGGQSSSDDEEKTEISRSTSTSGNGAKVTTITYSDGSTETITEYGGAPADPVQGSALQSLLKQLQSGDLNDEEKSKLTDYMKTMMSGGLINISA